MLFSLGHANNFKCELKSSCFATGQHVGNPLTFLRERLKLDVELMERRTQKHNETYTFTLVITLSSIMNMNALVQQEQHSYKDCVASLVSREALILHNIVHILTKSTDINPTESLTTESQISNLCN